MIIVIDNYDSFTYNLVQYLQELGETVRVFRNDETTPRSLDRLKPDALLISPGPGNPDESGISIDAIRHFAGRIPVLGVCLGHQAIGQAFGGRIVRARRLMHGKISPILHDRRGVFQGLPQRFEATRYHSLLIERASLPACLKITAWTREGEIMGVRHRSIPALEGVQFHPESILTAHGKSLLKNFLALRIPPRKRR